MLNSQHISYKILILNTSQEGKQKKTADNIQNIFDKQVNHLRTSIKLCSYTAHTCQIQFSRIWVNKA